MGILSALVLIGHVVYVVYKRNRETPAPLDHEPLSLDHESLVASINSGMSNYGAVHNEEI